MGLNLFWWKQKEQPNKELLDLGVALSVDPTREEQKKHKLQAREARDSITWAAFQEHAQVESDVRFERVTESVRHESLETVVRDNETKVSIPRSTNSEERPGDGEIYLLMCYCADLAQVDIQKPGLNCSIKTTSNSGSLKYLAQFYEIKTERKLNGNDGREGFITAAPVSMVGTDRVPGYLVRSGLNRFREESVRVPVGSWVIQPLQARGISHEDRSGSSESCRMPVQAHVNVETFKSWLDHCCESHDHSSVRARALIRLAAARTNGLIRAICTESWCPPSSAGRR